MGLSVPMRLELVVLPAALASGASPAAQRCQLLPPSSAERRDSRRHTFFISPDQLPVNWFPHITLVAGAWTEREKMYHGGSFLKLADDNMDIQNPEAQNRDFSGF